MKILEDSNYDELVFDDLFEVIQKSKTPWPKQYTRAQKLKFLNSLEKHFVDRDDFEKCKVVVKIKNIVLKEKIGGGSK